MPPARGSLPLPKVATSWFMRSVVAALVVAAVLAVTAPVAVAVAGQRIGLSACNLATNSATPSA